MLAIVVAFGDISCNKSDERQNAPAQPQAGNGSSAANVTDNGSAAANAAATMPGAVANEPATTPAATGAAVETARPVVVIETSLGRIKIELDREHVPKTTANFLRYVDEKFYDGTIFHRVMPDFMIQGGGFTPDMKEKPTHKPIVNEAGNGLKNLRGTIAMARTGIVDSATAQFFISVQDNDSLNHTGETREEFGYAVFGKVIDGMDVVDKIRNVQTKTVIPHELENVPVEPVIIKSVRRETP